MLLEEGICYGQSVLLAKLLLACALSHFVLALSPRPNSLVTPDISWLPTFAFQLPLMKRTYFFALVLKGFVGLLRTVQLELLQH